MTGRPSKGRTIQAPRPAFAALDPTCPDELTDEAARAEWDRLAPGLAVTGQVTAADRSVLLAYCREYGTWLALRATIDREGAIQVKGTRRVVHVACGLADRAFRQWMRAAAELGITPGTRARVVTVAQIQAAPDEFAAAQRRRLN